MPVHYSGVLEEHAAVRQRVGLFDVSHMGEIQVTGSGAESLLERLTPNDVAQLDDGQAQYSALLTEAGTYIDDLLIYRRSSTDFMVVVNAANTARDLEWVLDNARGQAVVEDVSDRTALVALQGPRAAAVLSPVVQSDVAGVEPTALSSFGFLEARVCGAQALISRTGYTGEDGFEIYVAAGDALTVWEGLIESGREAGIAAVGLAARDTLRLEAGLMLHGNDIDETVTPFEAGLGWVVKMSKGDFVGRSALLAQRESGVARRMIGFELEGRRIARRGAALLAGDRQVGQVTSGTWSPTLERPIGLALMSTERTHGEPLGREPLDGEPLEVEIRGHRLPTTIVRLPFYRRAARARR